MAIGPYEAGLSPSQREFVDQVDALIEENLKRTWPTNQKFMVQEVPIPKQVYDLGFPERGALSERYRQAGWTKASVIPAGDYYSLYLER